MTKWHHIVMKTNSIIYEEKLLKAYMRFGAKFWNGNLLLIIICKPAYFLLTVTWIGYSALSRQIYKTGKDFPNSYVNNYRILCNIYMMN